MSAPASQPPKPLVGYMPATFLERGVVVPFTTPHLAGARIRPGERDRLELVVANPAGTRGVYILPWEAVFSFCRPTVHDRLLNERIEAMQGVSPSAIRRLALDLAAEGLAGREAAEAAELARAAEQRSSTVANFELLLLLLAQTEPREGTAGEAAACEVTACEVTAWGTADLEARAKRAVAAVSAALGRSAEEVAALLETLAQRFAPIGVGQTTAQARIPQDLRALTTMRDQIQAWLRGPPAMSSPDADLVLGSANLTIACTRAVLDDARALLADLPALLRRWMLEPEWVAARLSRPDWLLDGWDRICLVWRQSPAVTDPLLAELADLVPATPREAADWAEQSAESMAGVLRHRRRKVQLNEDWRTGLATLDMVARNEHLRALALVS